MYLMLLPMKLLKQIFENLTPHWFFDIPIQLNNNKSQTTKQSGDCRIDWTSCDQSYSGETGLELSHRIRKYKYDIRQMKPEAGIANHVAETHHSFDFNNERILFPCDNVRKWHYLLTFEFLLICYFICLDRTMNLVLHLKMYCYIKKNFKERGFKKKAICAFVYILDCSEIIETVLTQLHDPRSQVGSCVQIFFVA